MEILALPLLIALYFIPGLIANYRGHHNQGAIWILNLLLGWTLLGWVVALVWASTAVQQTTKPEYKWTPMRLFAAVFMISLFVVVMAIVAV